MDWYSWLSKTGLDPSLTYEYGRAFTRNELGEEDVSYFNHEFLQSMGISVAKHRLEILKLARKEFRGSSHGLSRLILALNKTKKLISKNIGKLGFRKDSGRVTLSELSPYRSQWTGALRNNQSWKEPTQEKAMVTNRRIMRSGPLDRRAQERLMVTNRSISLSGPLDGNVPERLMYTTWTPIVPGALEGRVKEKVVFPSRSPGVSGPLDRRGLGTMVNNSSPCNNEKMGGDGGVQSLWSVMFQDMKPT
ncbi:hypothetical protein RJ639_021223 [Escallonia herrerae]|uniref:SAM domain-containing protein n=1 Tax=Escallonia herrerae TaxID=1293975 RepID=A0AA89AHA9_9ASTE|nr:hypothetical protein RJ639_021223 [Escallonia herrerae]